MAINNPYKRNCLFCGRELENNHGNRLFCDPETSEDGERDCKITYNNLKAKEIKDKTKFFVSMTIKNMKILDRWYKVGIFIVTGDQLTFQGFDPTYTTKDTMDPSTKKLIPTYHIYKLVHLGNNNFKIEN